MAGIIRRIDDLGRVVIPMEYRRKLKIPNNAPLELILTDEDSIIIRTIAKERCDLCGEPTNLSQTRRGGLICQWCADDIYLAMAGEDEAAHH